MLTPRCCCCCCAVQGHVRTAVGKAQLLMSQRFQQFSSLIDDCALRRGVKVTTCDDLQGFWDMVYVQVEDVLQLFEQLQQLRLNDWQPLVTAATAAPAQGGRKPTKQQVRALGNALS